ncbi:hypothetical protein B6I39_23795 [Klebsiella quasipneumoniae]|nr:hypothetical protein B6I39_23795 [Klebsiella quasipneumoniae]
MNSFFYYLFAWLVIYLLIYEDTNRFIWQWQAYRLVRYMDNISKYLDSMSILTDICARFGERIWRLSVSNVLYIIALRFFVYEHIALSYE